MWPGLRSGPLARRATLTALAAALFIAGGSLAGCGSGDELTVAAAASLRPALGDVADGGADEVRFTFGGSDLLANQVRQGAGIDVIASASTLQPDQLYADGLVERPVEFAGNRLVVGVPEDSEIDSIEDIARPGTSLVIGDSSVPVGIYAREMIAGLPDATAESILDNVRSQEQDASSITAKLTQGAADVGLLYETDVMSAADKLRTVPVPDRLQPRIAYSAAIVSSSALKAEAEAFIESLVSGELSYELREAGLLPAP